jgi:hypothetical protein
VDELLEQFLNAPSASGQLAAVVGMTKDKSLARTAKTARFSSGLATLADRLESPSDQERMPAIIALARIAASVRPRREEINKLLAAGIKTPPEGITSLTEPEDRAYVVAACRATRQSWSSKFFARVLVLEEYSDRTREEAARGLIENVADFRSALQLVFHELQALRFETEHPSSSMAKRLRRTIAAIRVAYADLAPSPGEGAGRSLADNVESLFRKLGPPPAAPREELLIEVAALVHDLVRARFSQATIADTYEVLAVIKRWYDDSEWETLAPGIDALKHVSRDLSEALALLARAGVTDDRLVSALPLVTGSTSTALALRQALAAQTVGLTEEIRTWLVGLPAKKKSDAAEESQQRHADGYIAELLIRVWKQRVEGGRRSDAIPADVVEIAEALARSRSLVPGDNVGQTVEFSALEHEVVGGFVAGLRYVRILEPSVTAVSADGRVRTVRKALAEPVQDAQTQ